jgi:hypothetical protein
MCRFLFFVHQYLFLIGNQILSFRFYDGSTVSVPEFIDFFTSSSSSRAAKSAAAAVRASLNMLQLECSAGEASQAFSNRPVSNRILFAGK